MAPDEKKKSVAVKAELASLYGGNNDQLKVIAAFECWKRAKNNGQEAQFCSRYFVSSGTMHMLFSMRTQLQSELFQNGFIPEDPSNCSLNAKDPGILHAVLVVGLYPKVCRLVPPLKNNQRAIVETTSGAKVRLHPHSSNFKLSFIKSSSRPLVIYDEITRGDGEMHIKNRTVVGPYPLLLLAIDQMVVAPPDDDDDDDDDSDSNVEEDDEMEIGASASGQHEQIMSSPNNMVAVVVDRWLKFESTTLDVARIYCLREIVKCFAPHIFCKVF